VALASIVLPGVLAPAAPPPSAVPPPSGASPIGRIAPEKRRAATVIGMPIVDLGIPDLLGGSPVPDTKLPAPAPAASVLVEAPPAGQGAHEPDRTAPPEPPAAPMPVAVMPPPVEAPPPPVLTPPAATAAPLGARVPEAARPAVAQAVEAKVAELAGRGPEYAALATISREVIEQIAWEIVPELAEVIIRAELDRLVAERGQAK
jgi:hypothetical protein